MEFVTSFADERFGFLTSDRGAIIPGDVRQSDVAVPATQSSPLGVPGPAQSVVALAIFGASNDQSKGIEMAV